MACASTIDSTASRASRRTPSSPGGDFVYTVHFPDAGIYWYHPHVREDIEQAMGLFGNLRVDSPAPDYYSPANREQTLAAR